MKTLTTLSQIGLCNASLLTVHYVPQVQSIVEDMIVELVDEPIQHHFLDMIEEVEKIDNESPEPLKSLGMVLSSIAGESKNSEEFRYLVHTQIRVYNVWKTLEPQNRDTDENAEAGIYIGVGQHIVQQKTLKWAQESKTRLPAVDTTELLKSIVESLRDGSYFSQELYDKDLAMTPDGSLEFVGSKQDAEEDEWADEIG